MNDTLMIIYDNNPPDTPTLNIGRMEMVSTPDRCIPVAETTIINTFQGREAEKIYALLTQSCGAIFDMNDYLKTRR